MLSSEEWLAINEMMRGSLQSLRDDGEFWMSWTEYLNVFTDMTICSFSPDYDSDGLSDGLGGFTVYNNFTLPSLHFYYVFLQFFFYLYELKLMHLCPNS